MALMMPQDDWKRGCGCIAIITVITIFLGCLIGMLFFLGCETPYTGRLGPKDFNGWIESEASGFVCLWNGFDRICIQTIEGEKGQKGERGWQGLQGERGEKGDSGERGKDGAMLITTREVPIEVIVEKIVERVVVETQRVEVPVIVEKIVERIQYVSVPIETFVTETVEVIGDVCEGEIREVPVPELVEIVRTEYVDRPVIEYVDRIVYKDPPGETVQVTEGATYTESGYHNPRSGEHSHEFTHTHDGATHTHQIVHPNGERDDLDRIHNGYGGVSHN